MDPSLQTVQVDFEIDRRDLFKANLDLAKWRILIGIVVAVILAVGLTYFFILIDEKKILLQLSPLFIGVPVVAVGGQVLRLHASCRKFVAGLPVSQRRFRYMFQAEADGYDLNCGESSSHVAWQDVLKVIEKPSYFLIYPNRFEARLLPMRGFHQPSDIPILRDILLSKLGPRAKLHVQ